VWWHTLAWTSNLGKGYRGSGENKRERVTYPKKRKNCSTKHYPGEKWREKRFKSTRNRKKRKFKGPSACQMCKRQTQTQPEGKRTGGKGVCSLARKTDVRLHRKEKESWSKTKKGKSVSKTLPLSCGLYQSSQKD